MSGMMMGAAAWQLSGIPWTFDFNGKLTALPTALQRLNATYTRNSVKNVVQDGALVQLAANQFGTSYDAVTGLYGYVPEPAATNLLTYSSQYDHTNWAAKFNFAVTPDATTAPDGTLSADMITSATSSPSYCSQNITVTNGAVYTGSFFLKAGNSRYIFFGCNSAGIDKYGILDTQTGTITGLGIGTTASTPVALSGGWYRCSITFTTGATSLSGSFGRACAGATDITPVPGGTCYVWGAQVETGSRATSYIATTGSTATRAADVLHMPLANIPGFSSAAYTLFADCRADVAVTDVIRTLISIDDGTANNHAVVRINAAGAIETIVVSGGSTVQNVIGSAVGVGRIKIALSCSANSFLLAVNGVAGTSDVSGAMPVSPTTLRLGCNYASAEQANVYEYRDGLIPIALTQAQINELTS